MKSIGILFLGIALVVAGTAVLTYQGVTFTTAEKQLVSLGPLTAGTQELNWTITLPPILGGILLVAGTVLVFVIAIVKRAPRAGKEGKVDSMPNGELKPKEQSKAPAESRVMEHAKK